MASSKARIMAIEKAQQNRVTDCRHITAHEDNGRLRYFDVTHDNGFSYDRFIASTTLQGCVEYGFVELTEAEYKALERAGRVLDIRFDYSRWIRSDKAG